ncbi:hypothetical protein [Nostoc sp. ChiQUE01b]|uniref:hypothetical protein n=1 Tax=Nostoc sp. ChiQUE01b TaxID=3075376 RepID=UPI002AD50C97|nr:hypothetical protein [Nostoc sp. ChiQUE01b]MDZ8261260.1 hypothetical protein [Nostoc sp. ChiQUE01b]
MDNIEAMPASVNYALLEKALTAFEAVNKLSTTAQVAFSQKINLEIGKLLRHLTALPITPVANKNNELTLSSWNCLTLAFFRHCLTHLTIVR